MVPGRGMFIVKQSRSVTEVLPSSNNRGTPSTPLSPSFSDLSRRFLRVEYSPPQPEG